MVGPSKTLAGLFSREGRIFRNWPALVIGSIAFGILSLTSLHHYLLFHSLTEIFSVVIACGIFMFAWNSRRFLGSPYFLVVGISYLFVGILDTLHLLSYKGMGVFQGYDANLATELWVAARYFQSLSLLAAAYLVGRKVRSAYLWTTGLIGFALLLGSIFYWQIFPGCFIEGRGVTPFKIYSEYLISVIFLVAAAVLFRNRQYFDPSVLWAVVASLCMSVLSELSFSHYVNVYAPANIFGHLCRIAAFYFMYKAVIETGLSKPHTILFRDLKQREEELFEEKEKLGKYLDIAGAIIVVIDAGQKVTMINKKGCEVLGYRSNEIIGKEWFDHFVPAQIREQARNTFFKLMAGEVKPVEYFENPVLVKRGEERLIAWHNAVLHNEEGQIIATISSGEDITERKKVDEELSRLASFPALNPSPVLELDLDGQFKYLNPATHQMFPDLFVKGTTHAFLADFDDIVQSLTSAVGKKTLSREIHIGQDWFQQVFTYIEKLRRVRIYSMNVTERKRIEHHLRESELRFRLVIKHSPIMVFQQDRQLRYTWIYNPVLGYTVEQMVGKTDLDLFPGDAGKRIHQVKQSVMECGGGHRVEVELFFGENILCYDLVVEPLWDVTGEIAGVTGVFVDMTAHKEIEQKLQESEERFRMAVDHYPAMYMIYDAQRRFQFINAYGLQISGVTMEKVMGRRDEDVFPEDVTRSYLPILQRTFETRTRHTAECVMKFPTGNLTFIVTYVPWLDENGEIKQVMGITHDITERKMVESALKKAKDELELRVTQRTMELRAANEILEKILSATHFCVVYLDAQFNFIRVNKSYADACGYSPDFFIGKNHFDLYPSPENQAIFERVVKTGKPFSVFAKPFVFSDHPEWGVTYWDWSLFPLKDLSDKVEGLVFCLVDVTKRQIAEEELLKTQLNLQEAKRLSDIGTLAATVAHELRNPLAAIHIAAFNMYRKANNPLLEKSFSIIEKKVSESDQIINNLLFYSRLKPPHYERVNIHEVLEECLTVAQGRYEKETARLKKEFSGLKGVVVEADPLQVKEVLCNVINNAYDAISHCDGQVSVRGEVQGADIRIQVKDTGVGIEEEDLKKVFDPFFTTKAKGTGLGLTVCKQVITYHGGSIDIVSKKGQGTTVNVGLPRQRNTK